MRGELPIQEQTTCSGNSRCSSVFESKVATCGLRHLRSLLRAPFVPTTARSALLVRLRRLGDSGWTQGKAEAADVETVRQVAPVTSAGPAIRGLEVPTAATAHADRALTWASRIADCTFWIFFVPVAAPFPNIPMHVVKTPGIRFQKANRMCPVRTVAIKPTVLGQQTLFIIKRISRLATSATRVFPLGLGR
jgi:hypothetical protein